MLRRRLVLAAAALVVIGLAAAGAILVQAGRSTENEQGFLAGLISRALSTPSAHVQIGRVDGALSSDATIRDIAISDRDGVWLRLDRARIQWRRAALLLRRLEVDDLEIGHLEVLRRPIPSDAPVKDADKPILPDLPVKVVMRRFDLADLDLGQTVLGVAMRAAATGHTTLGSPSEGLDFHLDGTRLDSPGHFLADLTYRPAETALAVTVNLDEPAGGLVSTLGHLPGTPPVKLDLSGNGTLDLFDGTIDFVAGPTIDAKGKVTLRRNGAGRDLATRVGGHLGAMLPALAAPVFEGQTTLSSDLRFGDDGAVTLGGVALVSHLARLDAHGSLGVDRTMDFEAAVRAVPNTGEVSTLGAGSIRTLVFDSRVQGAIAAPRITANLTLADAHLPQGSLGRLETRFTAIPSGEVTDAATRIALAGDATLTGFAPNDAAIGRAIGGGASATLRGRMDTHGNAEFETIEAKTPTLAVAYAGRLGPVIHGRATATLPDLSRFGDVAGRALAGTVAIGADIDGTPRTRSGLIVIEGRGNKIRTGVAAADGLLEGGSLALKGRMAASDGRYRIEAFDIEAPHAGAHVAGTATADTADVTARVTLPDLKHADPRLAGNARLDAHLTGGLSDPALTLAASLDQASALSRPIPHLALDVSATRLRSRPAVRATLDGLVDKRPANGLVALEAHPSGGWALTQAAVTVGSVKLDGAGTMTATHRIAGHLGLAAADLDDLSALALTKLGGTVALDASFAAPDGHQSLQVKGMGRDIKAPNANVRRFDLAATGSDLYDRPVIDADATVDQAQVGGQAISDLRLTAKGAPTETAIDLTARAAGFDLKTAGTLVVTPATRFDLTTFSARRGSRSIALSAPSQFLLADGAVTIRDLAVKLGAGRIAVDGRVGSTLDLKAEAKAVPLASADIAMPGLGLGGTLDASARIAGTPTAPTGDYAINLRKVVAAQTKSAGVPPIDVSAKGKLDGHRVGLDAQVVAGRAGTVTATGSLPLGTTGAMDVAVRGKLDARVANATLGPQGRTMSGVVVLDAKVAGTPKAPRIAGSASMSGGTFRDTLVGMRLDGIGMKVVAQGDHIALEHLEAATPNGGTLTGSGDVRIDPAGGFPGKVVLRGHKATLADSSLMTATADIGIDVSGALARNPHVSGRVDITHVDVGIPDRLPSTLKPIDGVVHVNATGAAAARLALAKARDRLAKGTKGRAALFDAALDVTIAAPNRIFVRGRGVDAELGGDLHITGTSNHPMPNGAFALRSGKLSALGKTLTFTKGNLTFTGDMVPELDFAAEIAATSLTAQIAITGPAASPTFAFTSQPTLPQDEILSRVLFDKPSGNLTGMQALQLAQAAAQFSSGGDGAFEKLRKSLGVDSLDVGSNSNGSPSVGVSRAISDRVRLGVTTGATADQTGLSADIDVTRHVRVQSSVQSNGSTSVGVGTEMEY